jgi:hypothetical protein
MAEHKRGGQRRSLATTLCIGAGEDSFLGVFEIRQAQNGLGRLAVGLGAQILLHGEWPPCHLAMIRQKAPSGWPVIRPEQRSHRKNLATSQLPITDIASEILPDRWQPRLSDTADHSFLFQT